MPSAPKPPTLPSGPKKHGPAEEHYLLGNRLFEEQEWGRAADEWGRAGNLWRMARGPRGAGRRRFAQLWAALALVFSVLLIHQSLFLWFPRRPLDLILLRGDQAQQRSWLDRWLDNGRPQPADGHKITFREWWSRLREKKGRGKSEERAQGKGVRPALPERWADLLRRYGRWGDFYTWELDFSVISGNGLSRLGDYAGATEVLEAGVRRNREPAKLADLYQGLANAHYYEGYQLQPDGLATYKLEKVSKAASAYEQSLKMQPRSLSYGNLGWMYFLLGDYTRAEEYSRRALLANDNMQYVRLNLGLIHLVQGRLRESFESYYAVMRQEPGAEVFLGGINDLREVLRDHPGRHPFAYLIVGALAVKSGDLSQARDALTRFLAGPSPGGQWRGVAQSLLRSLDAADLER